MIYFNLGALNSFINLKASHLVKQLCCSTVIMMAHISTWSWKDKN